MCRSFKVDLEPRLTALPPTLLSPRDMITESTFKLRVCIMLVGIMLVVVGGTFVM